MKAQDPESLRQVVDLQREGPEAALKWWEKTGLRREVSPNSFEGYSQCSTVCPKGSSKV